MCYGSGLLSHILHISYGANATAIETFFNFTYLNNIKI